MTERRLIECPKCGARGKCDKHGMSASRIDLRRRAGDRGDGLCREKDGHKNTPPQISY